MIRREFECAETGVCTMDKHYDAIIVGTGQSGPALAARLNQEGQKTAVIERKLVGGTCVNVGCTPTKALVGSARVAWFARQAGEFGIDIGGKISVDMRRVKERKDRIVADSNTGVTKWLEGMENVSLIRGHARFVADRTIEVSGERASADRVFINVGARARIPDWPNIDDLPYLTNSSIMDVDSLPAHLAIIGGSYIGLEFAQMYRRFGSEVTVIEMNERIIDRDDEDVSGAVREILEEEGVKFRLGATCVGAEKKAAGIRVSVDCEDDPSDVEASHLLLAIGRLPNTDDLGLGDAGVDVDDRGYIQVDDELRSSAKNVWAIGDVNGLGAFTHTSYNDYEIVAANLFDKDARRASDRIPCYGLFTDPPLGRIGMTERQVRASGRNALVGVRPMSRVSRAKEFGDTRGFIKVLVDADTKEILGAAIIGMSGDEVVHGLLDVMYAGKPYTTISRAVHIHPTVSELIPTVLQELKPLE